MSISVTVHDIGPPSPTVPNPLADLENVRKNANEKLRIRRLVQVRQQSKDLAAKMRQNYQKAKVKELAKIEQIRGDELKAWKRKHMRELQDEYARCVGEVGEAHRAAEAAEECVVWFEEKRATQQAVALQRGRKAEATVAREKERKQRLAEAKARKKSYVPTKSIAVQAGIPAAKAEPIRESIPVANDEPSSTEATLSPFEQFCAKRSHTGATLPLVGHDSVLSESEDDFYGAGTRDKENLPGKGQDYTATAFTSPSDFRPVELPPRQRIQPFTQITELIQQRRQQQHPGHREEQPTQKTSSGVYGSYGTHKTVQFDDVSDNTISFPTSSVLTHDDRRPRSRSEIHPTLGDGSPRKVRPRKLVDHPKVSPVHPHVSSGSAQPAAMITKRGKAVLPLGVRETVPESGSSTSYGASTKVQYYDYNTRYAKEYDQPVAFVQREDRRGNDPTAMEEANRYEKLQQELANARRIPAVDRTKPALEKQQIRKDYEKLSKELDNLTRSENKLKSVAVPTKSIPTETTIKQKAAALQRKADEAIENLLQHRALVTCPVVRQERSADSRKKNRPVRAPVVNVAEMRSDGAFAPVSAPCKNVSSDSCSSIVLGTFDRPGIPLPGEGKGYERADDLAGGMDKISRMKELLEQINEQRRQLTVEIEKETAAIPDSVEEMCEAMQKNTELEKLERMKRRQEELLGQAGLLQKREHEVEELQRQLYEKMALLKKNKERHSDPDGSAPKAAPSRRSQSHGKGLVPSRASVHVATKGLQDAIEVEVEQPSTTSISSSEVGSYGVDVPVKIIITVNEKSTPSKKKHKRKALKKQSPRANPVPRAESKAVQMEEKSVEKEPLPAAPQLRKESRRPKQVVARAVDIDFSQGSTSTTSTVYRTLPPKIGSLKINSLLPPAPEPTKPVHSENSKEVPAAPKHQLVRNSAPQITRMAPERAAQTTGKEANLNPQLLSYIVRLLGMSRQSIDQLGVSSTSVSTPNASVVNVSGNIGSTVRPALAPNDERNDDETDRMNRLRKFIDENYNFLQEIDETLRRSDQSTLGSDGPMVDSLRDSMADDDTSRVADVWMKTLRSRERNMAQLVAKQHPPATKPKTRKKRTEMQHKVVPLVPTAPERPVQRHIVPPAPATITPSIESNPGGGQQFTGPSSGQRIVTKEGSLKSILKSPRRAPSPKIITPQEIPPDRREVETLPPHPGTHHIWELSQMLNQVREETRRLIEDSLSSLDQQESTKYMDLPASIEAGPIQSLLKPPTKGTEAQSGGAVPTVNLPSGGVVQLDDPVSEEIDNIISSRQIGLSKDSGIAMSRPLTASDTRESPPSEEYSQEREPLPFEPFLKDIGKPGTSVEIPTVNGGSGRVGSSATYASLQVAGSTAGGSSGSRKHPPVAIARFSPQMDDLPAHELSTILEVDTPAVAVASSSRLNDVSSLSVAGERSDTAKEMVLIEARNKLLQEPASPSIGYDRFPNYEEYVRADGPDSLVRVNLEHTETTVHDNTGFRLDVTGDRDPGRLQYRSFPESAPPFNITEDDSGSKNEGEKSNSQSNVSDWSLPDVVAELKKFNISLKPFDQSLDNSNRSTPLSEAPARQDATKRAGDGKQRRAPGDVSYGHNKDAASEPLDQLCDSLGHDLEGVSGLRWLSTMLKKNQQKHQQMENSSSSSSPGFPANSNSMEDNMNGSLLNVSSGKPPNLDKFISRELMMRTLSDLQSSSELSSSPGSHSALLRSLLNISNLEHTSTGEELATHTTATDNRNNVQRTSTPNNTGSSSLRGPADNADRSANHFDAFGNLYYGGSRLSSVHLSSSSGGSEKHQPEVSAPDAQQKQRVGGSQQGAK